MAAPDHLIHLVSDADPNMSTGIGPASEPGRMSSVLTVVRSSRRDRIRHRAGDFLRALGGTNVWRRRFLRGIGEFRGYPAVGNDWLGP